MNKIVVVGSINIDLVFKVDEMVRKGETIHSHRMDQFLGGKGFNQAIALKKAYPQVYLAVNHNHQDTFLVEAAKNHALDVKHMLAVDEPTGMAFIQVNQQGENCIVLNAGANGAFSPERLDTIFSDFAQGDILVLQNEINNLKLVIEKAKAKGLKVALNPSPWTESIRELPLKELDFLIVNEIEGGAIAHESDPERILNQLHKLLPNTCVVLTLGADGLMARHNEEQVQFKSIKVEVVDTTAAGDTFLGYFLGAMSEGLALTDALNLANHAAALCCTIAGASNSIPNPEDVKAFMKTSA